MFANKEKPAGLIIRNLSRQIGRKTDSCAGRKYLDSITGTNGWIIGYIAHNSDREVFQRDIEEEFSVRRSTVSRVVTLMEEKGLVHRQGVEGDARLKKLVLTDKAMEIHKTIEAELETFEKILTDGISDDEMAVFLRVCEKMNSNIASED